MDKRSIIYVCINRCIYRPLWGEMGWGRKRKRLRREEEEKALWEELKLELWKGVVNEIVRRWRRAGCGWGAFLNYSTIYFLLFSYSFFMIFM